MSSRRTRSTVTVKMIRQICEAAVPVGAQGSERRRAFRLPEVTRAILTLRDIGELAPSLVDLEAELPSSTYGHVCRGLVRNAFFAELVKLPGCETTLYQTRWQGRLVPGEPRYAPVRECTRILEGSSALLL